MLDLHLAQSFRGQIREVDGLRGIAIGLVLMHHFWPSGGTLARAAEIAHLGWIGVDLFFVISGFLIAGILLDTKGDERYYRNFYARRGLRIFPLYYVFLLLAFTVIPLVQSGPYFSTTFLQESGSPFWYLLYGGNWREALLGREPAYILAPLWSLSIEEQFYLTFPWVVAICSRRQLTVLLLACVAFAPGWRAATMWLFPDNERIQYLATLSRIDVIAWGGLLAIGLRFGWLPRARWSGGLLVGALAVCMVTFILDGFNRRQPFCRVVGYSLLAMTFALLVLWAVQQRETWRTAWLRTGPLCGLGGLCYGVYLLQRPAEIVLLKGLGRLGLTLGDDSVVLMGTKCLFTVGVAWISWRCFERPILGFKRFFTSRSHPALATAVREPSLHPVARDTCDCESRQDVPGAVAHSVE